MTLNTILHAASIMSALLVAVCAVWTLGLLTARAWVAWQRRRWRKRGLERMQREQVSQAVRRQEMIREAMERR